MDYIFALRYFTLFSIKRKEGLFALSGNIKDEWIERIEEFCLELEIQGFAFNTIKNYRSKLPNMADFFILKNIYPMELTKQDTKELIRYWKSQNYQHSTINIAISRLKKFYDYHLWDDETERLIKPNPAYVKQLPMQKKIIKTLNETEVRQLLNAVKSLSDVKYLNQRNLVMLMSMLDCGLRVSEVCNLNNSNVQTKQIYIFDSKNNKDRAVAVSPILRKEIIKFKRLKKVRYGESRPDEPFFLSYQLGRLYPQAISEVLKTIKKKVKFNPQIRLSPHTLRHTYAVMQIKNGLDIYTLSMNLGHEELSTTQKYLQTLSSEDFIEESVKSSTLMNLDKRKKRRK